MLILAMWKFSKELRKYHHQKSRIQWMDAGDKKWHSFIELSILVGTGKR